MAENSDVFDFSPTDTEMQTITGMDPGRSLVVDYHNPDTISMLSQVKLNI